jgi:predicted TIM-barrel fold metal-dependent hydrolase
VIVDCHTHIWDATQPGKDVEAAFRRAIAGPAGAEPIRLAGASIHHLLAASKPVDKTFVLAFKSRYLDIEIPNSAVAAWVREHPDKLIGFAGIDPTQVREAIDDMLRCRDELGLKGVTVSPAAQNFHPADTRAMQVFAEAARLKMPVLVQPGVHVAMAAKMEFARPHLLDEVAREFPTLKLIVAHLGHPWIEECLVLLGKHANVFADVSGLVSRPWQAYQALVAAHEHGVMNKLLFGSDFPRMSATTCIEALYSINQVVQGTGLPTVPRAQLQSIVERDALPLLGLGPATPPARSPARILDEHEG